MSMISNIEYLVGNAKVNSIPFKPFAKETVSFLDDLSIELKKIKNIKKFPDLISLSFWCRRNNIEQLKKKYLLSKNRLGLGLIFHITPSNIPTNFAYSLIFGLITGNSNIVKVPSKTPSILKSPSDFKSPTILVFFASIFISIILIFSFFPLLNMRKWFLI